VSTYVILGMGEDRALTEEGCRRAIEMGVYPFVVPLRPVPGTLMADAEPPAPDYVASVYRVVSAMLAEAGFDHADAGAGCARCQACSGCRRGSASSRRSVGVSSPTAAPPRPDVRVRLCSSQRQRAAHHAVRRAVFVDEQDMFAGDDRDERDARITTLHAIGIAAVASPGRCGSIRCGGATGRAIAWPSCPRRVTARSGPARALRRRDRGAARRSAHGGHDPAAQRRVLRGLGWHRDGAAVAFHGRPHQPMAIALSADA
jgi:hypothetical protein